MATPENFRDRQGGALSLSDLDRLMRSVQRIDKITVDGNTMEMVQFGNTIHLSAKRQTPVGTGSGTAIVLCTDVFDFNAADNWNYYPGVVIGFVPGTGWVSTPTSLTTTFPGGNGNPINCWLVDWYTYTSPLPIGTDGASARLAMDTGYLYDPNGDLGQPLPVYACTQYTAMINSACGGDPQQVTVVWGD